MPAFTRFKVDTSGLLLQEKALLGKLILAAQKIVPLYEKQRNNKYPGANFYPYDVDKKTIEQAAKENPAILDPYTFVEREGGGFKAIPFHQKFKKELLPISQLLKEAAKLSEDPNFARYLELSAKALMDGSYREKEIFWLESGVFDSKFNFIIGPVERYADKLFFKKCAYQAWVGIMNQEKTERARVFKEMILTSQRKILPGARKVEVGKLRLRIDETIVFSGLIADFMGTGTNLPNDVELMEKYGSNLIIFNSSLIQKFESDQFPVFRVIFKEAFQKEYSAEELYEGSLNCILLHEITHSLIRYGDAEKRLKELFPVFDELLAYILGIKACGHLLLKGTLSQKELESILIMHICRNFTWWLDFQKRPVVRDYARGAAIATNFFIREGALKTSGGISWPDFTKMFICIIELSHILEHYLALGNYKEAKEFVDRYDSFEIFKQFEAKLKLKDRVTSKDRKKLS